MLMGLAAVGETNVYSKGVLLWGIGGNPLSQTQGVAENLLQYLTALAERATVSSAR